MSGRPKLLSIDAFAKTVEDAKIKTTSGGIITLVCIVVVLILIRNEYSDYTLIITRPELVVDREVNSQLDINLDVSFPNLPCDLITLDILDISGDVQLDILKSGFQKFRLIAGTGQEVLDDAPVLNGEVSLKEIARGLEPGDSNRECGSCYGSLPQEHQEYCCNSCEAVKLAYTKKMWAFYDGENIDQCEKEGYVARIKTRIDNNEGCRVKGTAQINRISGNLHFAPGYATTAPGTHYHDLSLYEKYQDKFNFDHIVNHFSFGSDPHHQDLNQKSTHPLDNHQFMQHEKHHVISYYLKVVATRFEYMKIYPPLETNQFSVISHDRPLRGGKDEDHQHTMHARGGIPGVFFHFDISPLKIISREQYAKTWSGFVLGVVSSIAGVLTVGTLLDRSVWAAEKVLNVKKDL